MTRMMQPGDKVVDYSWHRPDVAGLRAYGYSGVIRYIGNLEIEVVDSGDKFISVEEYNYLIDHYVAVALVYETTANRPQSGYAGGVSDAVFALEACATLEYPHDAVIFFAVDYDAAAEDVLPYFQGIRSVIQAPIVGVYGGIRVAGSPLLPVDYRWQTEAWSYGAEALSTHIFQRIGVILDGTDHNDVVRAIPFAGLRVQDAPSIPKPESDPNMYRCLQAPDLSLYLVRNGKKISLSLLIAADQGVDQDYVVVLRELHAAGMLADNLWTPIGWNGLAMIPWEA